MNLGKEHSIRTPLGRAKGLGSAKSGASRWLIMRATSIMLAPLGIYFLFRAKEFLPPVDQFSQLQNLIASPFTAVALIAFIVVGFHHAEQGVREVIEDYVHAEGCKLACLLLNRAFFIVAAIACLFSILMLALAGR